MSAHDRQGRLCTCLNFPAGCACQPARHVRTLLSRKQLVCRTPGGLVLAATKTEHLDCELGAGGGGPCGPTALSWQAFPLTPPVPVLFVPLERQHSVATDAAGRVAWSLSAFRVMDGLQVWRLLSRPGPPDGWQRGGAGASSQAAKSTLLLRCPASYYLPPHTVQPDRSSFAEVSAT